MMVTAISKALQNTRDMVSRAQDRFEKGGGGIAESIFGTPNNNYLFGSNSNNGSGQNLKRYRGWAYSAINALAMEGAGQPIQIGRIASEKSSKKYGTKTYGGYLGKGSWKPANEEMSAYIKSTMPPALRLKAADAVLEVIMDHPLIKVMNRPNPIQYSFQFLYSFIANLNVTGFAYVVGGLNTNGDPEFYSIPTAWVTPIHRKGAFAEFVIKDPQSTEGNQGEVLTRDNVRFVNLPDPKNPLSALSPMTAQGIAISIDEKIQTSQDLFFENSVFPSAIITIGKNPYPGTISGDGVRPRLTGPQRRQINAAIRKVMSGVSNYGNPAIIDGLIENITRLSASQNEIGWEKSEKTIKSRILSSWGVHPFILGEASVGSYAQAYVIKERFAHKTNINLSLASQLMTDFVPDVIDHNPDTGLDRDRGDDLLIWWDPVKPKDPNVDKAIWKDARDRGDVSQNEFRTFMNMPPDSDKNETLINSKIFKPVIDVASGVSSGSITPEQGQAILTSLGLPDDIAKQISGTGPKPGEVVPGDDPNAQGGNPPKEEPKKPPKEETP